MAMTGEVTLRGQSASYRRSERKASGSQRAPGIKTVLVPKENQADVEEFSTEITKGLEIMSVEHMDEVLKAWL